MRPVAVASMLVIILGVACGTPVPANEEVEVRVHNSSDVAFDSVLVQFPQDTRRYGRIEAGEFSDYRQVRTAYRYAHVEVWAGGERHVLQPVDYVGERPLASGRHTYGLTLEGQPPSLRIIMADQYERGAQVDPSSAEMSFARRFGAARR